MNSVEAAFALAAIVVTAGAMVGGVGIVSQQVALHAAVRETGRAAALGNDPHAVAHTLAPNARLQVVPTTIAGIDAITVTIERPVRGVALKATTTVVVEP